jgi:hypothetical protein
MPERTVESINMGSHISLGRCHGYHGIMPNCSIAVAGGKKTVLRVGDFGLEEFPGEPHTAESG